MLAPSSTHEAAWMLRKDLPAPPLAPLILALAAAALYLPTLGNGLTNFDDPFYVTGNPIASRGLGGILAAFGQSYDGAWYPLTHAVYALIHAFAGASPLAHHAVQIALFAGAVALVPRALGAFGVPAWAGFWAALLFAAHPLRVESVSWAANLKDTLSLVFVLGAFALYGAGRRKLSAVAFAAALLAKSMVFPVAGLFVLLEWRRERRLALAWVVPALILAGVGAVLHLGLEDGGGRTMPGGSLLAAIPSALWLPWWYLGRIFTAAHPQAVYAFEAVEWMSLRFAAAVVLWAAVGAALLLRRRWEELAGVAGWVLPFAAVTGLVPLVFPVADRYTLLPSLAVAAAVALALSRLPRLATAGICVALLAPLGVKSVARQQEWRHSIALWEADREREPEVVAVRQNLASAYAEARRWDDVVAELEAIEGFAPGRPDTLRLLFNVHAIREGMEPGRAEILGQPLLLGNLETKVAVSAAALKLKAFDTALLVAEAAVRQHESADAHLAAGRVQAARNRHDRALVHAEAALGFDPAHGGARILRAMSLVSLNRLAEALESTEAPLAEPRENAMLQATRATVLAKLGRSEEAIALLQQARDHLPLEEFEKARR